MRDISGKTSSLRTGKAVSVISCGKNTLQRVKNNNLPKGNLLDVARAAGFLASKKTHHLIPHCHPVSIDALDISFFYIEEGLCDKDIGLISAEYGIAIIAEGKSIGRTGIEMELLTAVSICALTIYDLLKPLGDEVEIQTTRLLGKTGGKSNFRKLVSENNQCAVLICSDSVAAGRKDDRAGPVAEQILQQHNADIVDFKIIPANPEAIQFQVKEWAGMKIPFVFTVGGTGLGVNNTVTDAVDTIIERKTPGIVDAMQHHGLERTPLAMMSRLTAGMLGNTLIVTLPGSSDGLRQSLEGILPGIFYAKKMLRTPAIKNS